MGRQSNSQPDRGEFSEALRTLRPARGPYEQKAQADFVDINARDREIEVVALSYLYISASVIRLGYACTYLVFE